MLIKAFKLRQVDRAYEIHLQAWLSFAAQAEKKTGSGKVKPKYSKFSKFYDYEREIDKVLNETDRDRSLSIGRHIIELQERDK